jgi:hypothetical protein
MVSNLLQIDEVLRWMIDDSFCIHLETARVLTKLFVSCNVLARCRT